MPRSSSAPPPRSGANSRCEGSLANHCPWSAMTWCTSPSAPAASSSRSRTMCGRKRDHIASMRNTPLLRAAATSDSASAAVMVNGFSTSTAFPASMASSAASWWVGWIVET